MNVLRGRYAYYVRPSYGVMARQSAYEDWQPCMGIDKLPVRFASLLEAEQLAAKMLYRADAAPTAEAIIVSAGRIVTFVSKAPLFNERFTDD